MNNIDIIYDQNVAQEKLKSGSKYERLTALVYKIIDKNDVVIHSLKLRGDGKTASHQIDVLVEKGSTKKRILIECKNYNSKVGLGIIRDFFGAVNQIRPAEAYVVTTIGFTKGAIKFAADEKINLFILREVLESDLKGRISKIHLSIHYPIWDIKVVSLLIDDEGEKNKLQSIQNKELLVGDLLVKNPQGNKVSTLFAEVDKVVSQQEVGKENSFLHKLIVKPNYIDFNGARLDGVVISISITYKIQESMVEADGIATLILQSIEGNISKIIQDTDLRAWTFNDDSEVSGKDG